jgi:hypothetical protein
MMTADPPRSAIADLIQAGLLSATTASDLVHHQMDMESRREARADRGMWFAFVIALSFLGVSGWLISGSHDVGGTILGSVDLVALVAVFITGRRRG